MLRVVLPISVLVITSVACVVGEENVAENAEYSAFSATAMPVQLGPTVALKSTETLTNKNPVVISPVPKPTTSSVAAKPTPMSVLPQPTAVPKNVKAAVVQETAANSPKPAWGELIMGTPPIYAASDINQSTIDLAIKWYNVATDAWGNYGPVEIYIIGTDIEAARKVEDDFCDRHKKLDSGWRTEWDCANANYELFTRYAKEGSAGVSTYNRDYLNYYFTTVSLSTQRPSPDEDDYKVVTMHEYFHVYQHAHISDTEMNGDRSARGNKNGGEGKPWFAEGTAEYFAQLLYSNQPGVRSNYLQEVMTRKYTSSADGYLAYNKGLKNLSYADPIGCSWGSDCWFATYDVGTWFIAYLVDQVGEETVRVDYYKDLDELGFETSFAKHFKKSSDEMVRDFEVFLSGGLNEALKILP